MSEVILINCPMILNKRGEEYIFSEGDEKSNPPMGILYLASYLRSKGIEVLATDISAEDKCLEDILDLIRVEKPRLVGLSATTASIRSAVKIAKEIRSEFGDEVVLGVGGAHVNSDHDFINRYDSLINFSIIGESEKTLYDVYSKILKNESFEKNLYGEAISDLDLLPYPARDLININNYFRDEEKESGRKPVATILGSRGCPYKCSFCSIPIINHKVRYRSAKNIVEEMRLLYDECGGYYSFQDDVMTLSKKHTIELCKEIVASKMDVKWLGMTRANALKPDVVEWLAKAGCNDLFIGVESGNERIRNDIIKKKVTDDQIKQAISLCRKHGIHTNLFLMIGFPTETLSEMEDTVNIGHKVGADLVGVRVTVPFPGTEVYDYAIDNKIIPHNVIDMFINDGLGHEKTNIFSVWPLFIPLGLEEADLVKVKKKLYRKFYLNPKFFIRRIFLWVKYPYRFKQDLSLIKMAPRVFFYGKTKGSMS